MAKDRNKEACPPCKKTSIGGQALMEGIMMRGPEKTSMAVRNAKGEIILETKNTTPMTAPVYKIPFVRGIFNMGASLVQGYQCLMRSADIAIADAEEEDRKIAEQKKAEKEAKKAAERKEDAPAEPTEPETPAKVPAETPVEAVEAPTEPTELPTETLDTPKVTDTEPTVVKNEDTKNQSAATTVVMIIGVVLGLALAIGLFIALPSFLYSLLENYTDLKNLKTESPYLAGLLKTSFEGIFKIILLVLYMVVVARMKEIRRVFMYHGAEHKTIFCYEQGLELTVDNIRPQKRFHPRCGTSFIILVLLVSMLIGFFIPVGLPTWARILIKIALLPVTIGFGYELIKLAGRKDNLLTRIISKPGVWLQHITTVEPDDSMIECAIAAMNEVIPEDKNADNW